MTRAWWTAVVLEALAALSAGLLSRRARSHRPVAALLLLGLACDVVNRILLDRVFTVPGPYTGVRRLAFHLFEILFTAYPACFAALALFVSTARRDLARRALAVWILFLAVCIGGYPWLRAGRFQWALTAGQLLVVAAGVAAGVTALRRRDALTTTHAVVFALFLAELAHLAGPFLSSPFTDWHYAQIAYCLAFGAAVVIHLEAAWTTPRSLDSSF